MALYNKRVEDIGTAIEVLGSLARRVPMRGNVMEALAFIERYVADVESQKDTVRIKKTRKASDK